VQLNSGFILRVPLSALTRDEVEHAHEPEHSPHNGGGRGAHCLCHAQVLPDQLIWFWSTSGKPGGGVMVMHGAGCNCLIPAGPVYGQGRHERVVRRDRAQDVLDGVTA
jgi:hypothetical protein